MLRSAGARCKPQIHTPVGASDLLPRVLALPEALLDLVRGVGSQGDNGGLGEVEAQSRRSLEMAEDALQHRKGVEQFTQYDGCVVAVAPFQVLGKLLPEIAQQGVNHSNEYERR
mgnify:CR=1 FL=1